MVQKRNVFNTKYKKDSEAFPSENKCFNGLATQIKVFIFFN